MRQSKPFALRLGGFTLVELLIVTSIIMVLLTAGLFGYSNVLRRARDTQRISDMEQIRTALELFYQDNNHYPGSSEGIGGSGEIIGGGGAIDAVLAQYMDTVPKDPINDATHYYAYDPQHRISVSSGCDLGDTGCNCRPSGNTAVVFGFSIKEFENTKVKKATCFDSDQNLNIADYNVAIYPAAP